MFIGREKELKSLESLYNSEKFEFAVIYGRRRVGKTALITEFIKDKKAVYFMGVESNAKQNLENFSQSIFDSTLEKGLEGSVFTSFQSALEYVFKQAQDERLVLVIDEYPYVARSSKSLASTLQRLIDQYKDHSNLMLILCGSSMSYMEDHVLSYKAPLYGRRTAQMKVEPFDFADTCRYLKGFSDEAKILAYAMMGGTPQYLLQLNDRLSIEENICQTFLNPTSSIYEEPENLLKQEVREAALYYALMSAIAGGASRMNEISTKVGEETSVCTAYLKNLMMLGLVKKEVPFGEKNSRKSIYSIGDNLFRFWFRFVPDNQQLIARGASTLALRRIEPHLPEFTGVVFEDICKQYLWETLFQGLSPLDFNDLGRWWGTNPKTREQEEIDIVGSDGKKLVLFAECKWTNEKVDLGILQTLLERSRMFNSNNPHFYLFSKTGFTPACEAKAQELGNVSLVTYREILEILNGRNV